MPLTLNGTTISAVNLNGVGLTSVTLNGQQVFQSVTNYTVSVPSSVSSSHSLAAAGTTVTLTVTPPSGQQFSSWGTHNPSGLVLTRVGSTNQFTFTMLSQNITIGAPAFQAIPPLPSGPNKLTIVANGYTIGEYNNLGNPALINLLDPMIYSALMSNGVNISGYLIFQSNFPGGPSASWQNGSGQLTSNGFSGTVHFRFVNTGFTSPARPGINIPFSLITDIWVTFNGSPFPTTVQQQSHISFSNDSIPSVSTSPITLNMSGSNSVFTTLPGGAMLSSNFSLIQGDFTSGTTIV